MKTHYLIIITALIMIASCGSQSSGGGGDDTLANPVTNINLNGAKALATKPSTVNQNVAFNNLSFSGVDNCSELGEVTSDQYQVLKTKGGSACFSDVEYWEDDSEKIYAKVTFQESSGSSETNQSTLYTNVTYSILTDSSGDVHYLPGHPKKRSKFNNTKLIVSHNGKPTYIASSGKLVSFDMSSDTEAELIDETISNFEIKAYSDGDHFFIDGTNDVKQIKPDNSVVILTGIQKSNWYSVGDHIQYIKPDSVIYNIRFDSDGNSIDCSNILNCVSNPVELNDWILNGGGGMPVGVTVNRSMPNCKRKTIGAQQYIICEGKAYRVPTVDEDVTEVKWLDYGHPGFDSYDTVRLCASTNYLFFYSQSEFNGNRLTWIDDTDKLFRDILDTHLISDLECISDTEVLVIGANSANTQTLRITAANTASPIVTVIDTEITEIITAD